MSGEWAKAFAVVGLMGVAGAVVGRLAGSIAVGAVGGIVIGMAINRKRECPVCMRHLQAAQAMIG